MNKLIYIFSFLAFSLVVQAQNSMGKSDDLDRIAIAPVVNEKGADIPPMAQKSLVNKMRQVISLNGLSADNDAPLFIMYPTVAIVDEELTPTAPVMYVLSMELSFVLADRYTGNEFNTVTYSLKGTGKTKEKAYAMGLKRIKSRDPRLKSFLKKGKESIIEYYNTHCDLVIAKAWALAKQGKVSYAYAFLNSVPPVCRECFDNCQEEIGKISKEYPDVPIPQPATVEPINEEPQGQVSPASKSIYVGNNLYLSFDRAEVVGKETQVYLKVTNTGTELAEFAFSEIWGSFIIDGNGHQHKLTQFAMANKDRNYTSPVIPGTPCPVKFVFNKVSQIKFLSFSVERNSFKLENLPVMIR